MRNETIGRIIGGFLGAALIAVGMMAFTPQIGTAQGAGQPPLAGRMGGGPPGRGMGRGGPGGPMGMAGIDPRDLTDAERQQIKAIRERHADDIKATVDRVNSARQALATAVLSGVGDIQGLALEVGAAEGEMAFQSAQIEIEVLGVLTPEQKQKIQDRRKEMESRRAAMVQLRQSRENGAGNGK
jgi:Spy/CpxP family protein refolding chaperone